LRVWIDSLRPSVPGACSTGLLPGIPNWASLGMTDSCQGECVQGAPIRTELVRGPDEPTKEAVHL